MAARNVVFSFILFPQALQESKRHRADDILRDHRHDQRANSTHLRTKWTYYSREATEPIKEPTDPLENKLNPLETNWTH